MSDKWTNRLSDYLAGELTAGERDELEAHLAACEECSATLDELRSVVARAQMLEDRPPIDDLWTGIAARIGSAPAVARDVVDLTEQRREKERRLMGRRFSFSFPQLAAASIALMILSSGTAWLFVSAGGQPTAVTGVAGVAGVAGREVPAPGMVSYEPGVAERKYGTAIADLEWVLAENRSQLAPETVQVIEQNLRIIDRAIFQARRALAADPSSSYLNDHLSRTMRQKLEFLQRATALAGAAS